MSIDWDKLDRVIAQQAGDFSSVIDRAKVDHIIAQHAAKAGERRLVELPDLSRVRFEPAPFEQLGTPDLVITPAEFEAVELEPVEPVDDLGRDPLMELSLRETKAWLLSVCPDALGMMDGSLKTFLYRRVDGSPELLVHAVLSCRRALVAVADVVKPPGEDGAVERDLGGKELAR